MSGVHPVTQARRDALRVQFDGALIEFVRSTIALNAAGVPVADFKDQAPAFDVESLNSLQGEAYNAQYLARETFEQIVDEWIIVVAQYMAATQALPETVWDAAVQVAAHQMDYEHAAHEAQAKIAEHAALDVLTGRTRASVVQRLVAAGQAPTAADKAASGDPEYTDHKDRTARASDDSKLATVIADVTLQKLKTSRQLLHALVLVQEARAGAPQITLTDPTRGTRAPVTTAPHDGGKGGRTGTMRPRGTSPKEG